MIEKDSNLHKELAAAFKGDPVRVTISIDEDIKTSRPSTLGGDGTILLVFHTKNIQDNKAMFEIVASGNINKGLAILALEEAKRLIEIQEV